MVILLATISNLILSTIMKNFQYLLTLTLGLSLTIITSCKKDDPAPVTPITPTPTAGKVELRLEHIFGSEDETFALNNVDYYVTSLGDSVKFNTFKYYISNIELLKADGSSFKQPESYFLVDASNEASNKLQIPNVPPADYTGIRFLLGVDSTRNVSGAQEGALSQANGMFWTWNSGYIFSKAEGISPQVSGMGNSFTLHVGGFTGSNKAIQTKTITFNGEKLTVNGTREAEIHLTVDVKEYFSAVNPIQVATTNMVMMPGATARQISENFKEMFSFEHLHN
jgi:hypothetical protein